MAYIHLKSCTSPVPHPIVQRAALRSWSTPHPPQTAPCWSPWPPPCRAAAAPRQRRRSTWPPYCTATLGRWVWCWRCTAGFWVVWTGPAGLERRVPTEVAACNPGISHRCVTAPHLPPGLHPLGVWRRQPGVCGGCQRRSSRCGCCLYWQRRPLRRCGCCRGLGDFRPGSACCRQSGGRVHGGTARPARRQGPRCCAC